MVRYFKELENPNNYYLDLIDTNIHNQDSIDLKILPLEFFEKYSSLFYKIRELDLLFDSNGLDKKLYLDLDDDYYDIPLEDIYSSFINGFNLESCCFSKNGIDKLNYLKKQFENKYIGNDFIDDFEVYFMAIYDLFLCSDNGLTSSKNRIFHYLSSAKIIAKYQDKLSKRDELLFEEALNYIKNYKIDLPQKSFEPVRIYLPNSWYITPYNHLYNTMGPDGHKEANLIYPLYYYIIRDDSVTNPKYYLNEIKNILKKECIDVNCFSNYTNLKYNFSSIYPDFYYSLDSLGKVRYDMMHKKTYDPRIIKLIIGIQSAHAGLFSFFYNLKNNSCNYDDDLKFIRQFELDEILVRCCGFHKISSICDKTITTSCINYEEKFEEYIRKGWTIDFIKPIILNSYTRRVEEYSDEFLLIKKMHCDK